MNNNNFGRVPGPRPADQAPAGLGGCRFDPARIGDLPDRLFVAWIEEIDDMPPRVASLLDEAATLLADLRKALAQ